MANTNKYMQIWIIFGIFASKLDNLKENIFNEINAAIFYWYKFYLEHFGNEKFNDFDHYCCTIKSIRNDIFEFANNIINNIKDSLKKIFGMDCSDYLEEFLANDKWKDYE